MQALGFRQQSDHAVGHPPALGGENGPGGWRGAPVDERLWPKAHRARSLSDERRTLSPGRRPSGAVDEPVGASVRGDARTPDRSSRIAGVSNKNLSKLPDLSRINPWRRFRPFCYIEFLMASSYAATADTSSFGTSCARDAKSPLTHDSALERLVV